jgi:hypothetical protein
VRKPPSSPLFTGGVVECRKEGKKISDNGSGSKVKTHYIELKLVVQSPFLKSKSSDFSKKTFKWC